MPVSPVLTLSVFAFTLFLSATLLFLVQPMIGKMMLPHLGGTPAVWNTCMVFFQAVLLLGYSYAHATTTWLGPRARILLHAAVLVIPVVVFPITVAETWAPAADANPVPAVLGLLFVTAGLPFFVVSTSAPLLQKWFAGTTHPSARDPYFLYGASNLGSMLALVAYPAVVEPFLRVPAQSLYWSIGYGLLAVLTLGCAGLIWVMPQAAEAEREKKAGKPLKNGPAARGSTGITRNRQAGKKAPKWERAELPAAEKRVTGLERLHWVALAFVPSSLMLGATTYITTDVAAIPLLWVLPLGLYLVSFILVFSRLPEVVHKAMVVALPLLILLQIFMMMSNLGRLPMWGKIGIHLVVLFVAAMVCHGELARRRPATRHLTEYYLLMSVGGVLGGAFNALLAPIIFNGIVEYPLAMVLALLLLPRSPDEDRGSDALFKDFGYPAALGVLALILIGGLVLVQMKLGRLPVLFGEPEWLMKFLENRGEQIEGSFGKIIRYGLPVVICYTFVDRPLRLALGVTAILLVFGFVDHADSDVIHQERSFFGVLKVERSGDFHRLVHGTTLHGTQRQDWDKRTLSASVRHGLAGTMLASTDPLYAATYWAGVEMAYWNGQEAEWLEPRREALTYYHRTGPIGQVMRAFRGGDPKPHVAVIGLGTGTMASHGEPGQRITFYDIDKHVVEIAENARYFTYLKDARERGVQVPSPVLGDARVKLKEAIREKPDEKYGIMVIDAFSSDAIPVHLITREAIEVYLQKLEEGELQADGKRKPGGILAFHISNRHLDLEPVLGNLAKARLQGVEEGKPLAAVVQHDGDEGHAGKAASTWVLLARDPKDFGELDTEYRWQEQKPWVEAASAVLGGWPESGYGGRAAWWTVAERRPRWRILKGDPKVGEWTDDYSNLLKVFNWK